MADWSKPRGPLSSDSVQKIYKESEEKYKKHLKRSRRWYNRFFHWVDEKVTERNRAAFAQNEILFGIRACLLRIENRLEREGYHVDDRDAVVGGRN